MKFSPEQQWKHRRRERQQRQQQIDIDQKKKKKKKGYLFQKISHFMIFSSQQCLYSYAAYIRA